jgi:hypothetical protein
MSYDYLATPYTHENKAIMDLRYECANHAAGNIMKDTKRGVFSPISHFHNIRGHGYLKQWTLGDFLDFDRAILDHADKLLVLTLDGWYESPGVNGEIVFAVTHEPQPIPVYYIEPKDYVPKYPLTYLTEAEKKYVSV